MKKILLFALVFPVLQDCFAAQIAPGFEDILITYGLTGPVAAEYAPDGRLFIVEKQGRIRIFKDGSLLRKPFLTVKVNAFYERGLLGLAFDPQFERNHYVYIYRTTAGSNPQNIVERYTANGDVAVVSSRRVLLDGIRSDTGFHNAGCIRFGPDGKLYVAAGDGGLNQDNAQDLGSLNGKILRINPDGSVPADNPFVNTSGARPEIWCYGFRNPWRFAIHPQSGIVAIGDVGNESFEELNVGRAGSNYGWPRAEGSSDNTQLTGPFYGYDHKNGSASIIAGTFYTGKKFPSAFRNKLIFGDYARNFIKVIGVDNDSRTSRVRDLALGLAKPVHIFQTADEAIGYVDFHHGEIRKIRYVGGSNRQPIVFASASVRSGIAPLTVRFNSNGTVDPDGDPLTYLWSFGDGATSTLASPSHTYSSNGTYFVLLSVRDNNGSGGDSRSMKIVVGNRAPNAEILTPGDGTFVRLGETVQFSGKGTDPEDGKIPPESLLWSARLHHNDHTHPVFSRYAGATGSFSVPSVIHAEGRLFFRLTLRALDSDGLSDSAYVDLPIQQ
jgi:glucose/arabinose dehydrogenase